MKFYDSAEKEGKNVYKTMFIHVHNLVDVQFLDECNLGHKTTRQNKHLYDKNGIGWSVL